MKQYYMVEFELPNTVTQDFIQRIPEQRKFIDALMLKGTVKSYSLALNRSRLWMITGADSEFDVMDIISNLPLSEFLVPSITPLMFHNSTKAIREFSLN